MERSSNPNPRLFLRIILAIVGLDVVTKALAAAYLPLRMPQELLGQEWMRLTLVYNTGAAFGLRLPGGVGITRVVFIVLSLVALFILWRLYLQTRPEDWRRVSAVALVCGGAVGNLIDRIRSSAGVVDFLDFGIGANRWPTFNVADMAVSTGAILLAVVLWREEGQYQRKSIAAPVQAGAQLTKSSGGNAL